MMSSGACDANIFAMNAKTITLIKKAAALLLLVCFVLPLSRCTTKAEVGGQPKVTDSYTYGYEIVEDAWDLQDLKTVFMVLIVFFVPAVCLRVKERPQAVTHFISSFVAAYVLYIWVFVFATNAEIGGILAVICWALLFCISCVTLCGLWRRGSLFKPAAAS